MRNIPIDIGGNRPNASVQETETPGTWTLSWTGNMEQPHARRMLKAAENAILQNGGEQLVLTCPTEQETLRAELERWPSSMVSKSGDRYKVELITTAKDGRVHEDDDFRTTMYRITCATCVERIARSRIKRREDALGKSRGPREIARHSRLIAEAYTRLAEIEENMTT